MLMLDDRNIEVSFRCINCKALLVECSLGSDLSCGKPFCEKLLAIHQSQIVAFGLLK